MRARAKCGELDFSSIIDADEGRLVAGLVDIVGRREDGDAQTIVLDAETLLPDLVRAEDGGDCEGEMSEVSAA